MFTSDLSDALYNQSLHTKKFFLEDVYVGMMAHDLKANFTSLNRNYCWNSGFCTLSLRKDIANTYFFFLKGPREVYNGWNKINEHVMKYY